MSVLMTRELPLIRWRRWPVLLALALSVPAALATPPGGSLPPEEAQAWLAKLQNATRRQSFQGIFVVSSGSRSASARIAHVCDGRDQYERIDALDGPNRQVFRRNDVVQTVWPAAKVAVVEQREAFSNFPALVGGAGHITDAYELRPQGVDRVAGHDADVLVLNPRDRWRFGHRLWVEKTTGLLLRAEVLDEHGEVLEWSAFSELSIGSRVPQERVAITPRRLEGFDIRRPDVERTELEREGWILRQGVPGFAPISCVRRRTAGEGAHAAGTKSGSMIQAVYGDGMTHVSVFIEPFDPGAHRRELLMTNGATRTVTQRQGDWWLTVVGDVPVATLRAFASALERKP